MTPLPEPWEPELKGMTMIAIDMKRKGISDLS